MRISDWSSDVCSSDLAEHFGGTDRFQVIRVLGLAADRMHRVAGAAEDVDSQRADAAGRAGHRERPELRRLAVFLHAQQRQRGGEAGGAQDHAFAQVQPGRQRDRPARPEPRVFRDRKSTSELQSLMRISYAVFCLKKKNTSKYKI